ncbi:hypothetical protein SAMN05660690_2770 [Geodermatophilus telluris]|uniref:Uncharacterized protein n=1 Tax=Geodermatophilus telluris TaxID=1190417 RepID=A0A1G6QAB4_9ACTN|nr:hypothetical protein [Geodermatophilus telluris]SDC88607.1 hypothetical protein SAMN05660690_2770 [Geodermatophilus telluris]
MNEQQTPSGNRWEPSGAPTWHPEHTPDAATGTPHATTTAQMPAAPAPSGALATGKPRRLPAKLRQRAAVGAATAALLAIGGVGGFAVGQAATGDGAASPAVQQGGTTTDPDGDGFLGGRPDFGQGTPPGFGGTPPGFDDGTTDDGTTDDGTTPDDDTTGDAA